MENLSEISGYVASTLVLLTFVAKDMRLLRTVAIFSNLAFITYGTIEWLPPVLFLHMVLLPLNAVRLVEVVRTTQAKDDLVQRRRSIGKGSCLLAPEISTSLVRPGAPVAVRFRGTCPGHPPGQADGRNWHTAESWQLSTQPR